MTEKDLLTKQRVHELQRLIKESEIELEKIKSKCNHPSYFIGIWSYGSGRTINNAKICDICGDLISAKFTFHSSA